MQDDFEDLPSAGEATPARPGPAFDRQALFEPIARLLPRSPVTIEADAPLAEAVRIMRDRHIGCVLVVNAGRLAGILTERDVLLKVDATDRKHPVHLFMTPDPDVLRLDDPILYALNRMSVGGFRHVPLVDDDDRPVGIVSVKDVVHYLVALFPNEVLTLPPEPPRRRTWQSRDGA